MLAEQGSDSLPYQRKCITPLFLTCKMEILYGAAEQDYLKNTCTQQGGL